MQSVLLNQIALSEYFSLSMFFLWDSRGSSPGKHLGPNIGCAAWQVQDLVQTCANCVPKFFRWRTGTNLRCTVTLNSKFSVTTTAEPVSACIQWRDCIKRNLTTIGGHWFYPSRPSSSCSRAFLNVAWTNNSNKSASASGPGIWGPWGLSRLALGRSATRRNRAEPPVLP